MAEWAKRAGICLRKYRDTASVMWEAGFSPRLAGRLMSDSRGKPGVLWYRMVGGKAVLVPDASPDVGHALRSEEAPWGADGTRVPAWPRTPPT